MTKRDLTDLDRRLWKRVADSTTPLLGRHRPPTTRDDMAGLLDDAPSKLSLAPVVKNAARQLKPVGEHLNPKSINDHLPLHASHPIDKPVIKKISRGRRPMDARLDLHGLTQDRAKLILYDFLINAQRKNHRIILVITGKGRLGSGILRQMVPIWLTLPQFLPLVNGFQNSEPHHGGEGALYVRLRRPKDRKHP